MFSTDIFKKIFAVKDKLANIESASKLFQDTWSAAKNIGSKIVEVAPKVAELAQPGGIVKSFMKPAGQAMVETGQEYVQGIKDTRAQIASERQASGMKWYQGGTPTEQGLASNVMKETIAAGPTLEGGIKPVVNVAKKVVGNIIKQEAPKIVQAGKEIVEEVAPKISKEISPLIQEAKKYKSAEEFVDVTPKEKLTNYIKEKNPQAISEEDYLLLRDNAIKDFTENETGRRTFPDNIDWENLQGHSEYGSPLTDKAYKWLDNYIHEKPVQNLNDDIAMQLEYFVPNKPIKVYRGGEMNRGVGGTKVNSWTHDINVARKFAGNNGKIYEAVVNPSDVIFDSKMVDPNYDIPSFSSWEDEVIVRSKIKGSEIDIKPEHGKLPVEAFGLAGVGLVGGGALMSKKKERK